MGCCVSHNGTINDIPFEEIDSFNKLKVDINQILNNKNNIDQTNNNILLNLINKISIKIVKCEEVIETLKYKKKINPKIINELIDGVKINIKELKEYNIYLNNQVKKNKAEINQTEGINEIIKQKENIKEEIKINKNINNGKLKCKNNLNLNEYQPIYFKKYARRNKTKEIFSKSIDNNSKIYSKSHCITYNNLNNNILKKTNVFDSNVITSYDDKNKINIIFIFENGKKFSIQSEKDDKFLNALNKLGKKVNEYNNIDNMIILDGNNNITDRVKNEELISNFGFNDYHFIQIKLLTNKQLI